MSINRKNPNDAHVEFAAQTRKWSQQPEQCKLYERGVEQKLVQDEFHLKTQEGNNLNLPFSSSREHHTLVQTPANTPNTHDNRPNTWYLPSIKRNKRPSLSSQYKRDYNKLQKEKSRLYEHQAQQEPEPTQQELQYTHSANFENLANQSYSKVPDKTFRQIIYLHEKEHWPFKAIAQKFNFSSSQVRDNYHAYKHPPNQSKKSKWEH